MARRQTRTAAPLTSVVPPRDEAGTAPDGRAVRIRLGAAAVRRRARRAARAAALAVGPQRHRDRVRARLLRLLVPPGRHRISPRTPVASRREPPRQVRPTAAA